MRAAAQSHGGKQTPDLAFRDSFRNVCTLARDQGLRVEQLLIILKQFWSHLTEARVWGPRESEERLSRLVTTCIEEYYRSDSNN